MREITEREFVENERRVDSLIDAYRALSDANLGNIQARNDVLRAAVVLLHSTLEEILRNIYLWKLPDGSLESLNRIPFVGHAITRPKGILLGELREFRGQFIENIIRDSIDQYVDTLNINNTTQLSGFLDVAGLSSDPVRRHFTALNQLMLRRHQIVHQMDREDGLDPLDKPVAEIDLTSVQEWRNSLHAFFADIIIQLSAE